MTDTLQAGTLFKPELVKEVFSKVKGESILAKLSAQEPIPFSGIEQMIFNLEGNAEIVGEGGKKGAGKATFEPVVIKPVKFVYQARVSDEFIKATEEKQMETLRLFSDGFSKVIAKSFDIAAIHGLEPKSMTDANFKATNSFDGKINTSTVTYEEAQIEDNIDAAVAAITLKEREVTGMALSPTAGQALAKLKDKLDQHKYSEFRFGQKPDSFFGMKTAMSKVLSTKGGSAETDHVIVGDFENMFKWGYTDNIPLEVIQFGDPDGTGRDLKAYNEVCLRAEAYIGWGILDADSFARVKTA